MITKIINFLIIKIASAQTPGGGTPLPGGGTPGGTGGGTYGLPNPLEVETFAGIINNVAYYLTVYIAPPIVTLMILFAAFQILTAGDNPEKLKTGKQIILWTVVGYGIILISWGVTSIIQQLLSG